MTADAEPRQAIKAHPDIVTTSRPEGDRDDRCTCPVDLGQLRLFESDRVARPVGSGSTPDHPWPWIATSADGRVGFWYRRAPEVFFGRQGIGPLLLAADTSVLIELEVTLPYFSDGSLLHGPSYADQWPSDDRALAIQDIVQLWYFRDVRFLIGDTYPADSIKPLSERRHRTRVRIFEELGFHTFGLRGGTEVCFDRLLEDETRRQIESEIPRCTVHPEVFADQGFESVDASTTWPTGDRDRRLVAEALEAGAHAFITFDKGVLKRRASFERHGLSILAPQDLLRAMRRSGELSHPTSDLVDIDTLTRIWTITGALEDAE